MGQAQAASAPACFAIVFPLSTISCRGLTASRLQTFPSQYEPRVMSATLAGSSRSLTARRRCLPSL